MEKEEIKIYTELPKGWKIIVGASNAPVGYVWISNNTSRFSKEYEHALLKI